MTSRLLVMTTATASSATDNVVVDVAGGRGVIRRIAEHNSGQNAAYVPSSALLASHALATDSK